MTRTGRHSLVPLMLRLLTATKQRPMGDQSSTYGDAWADQGSGLTISDSSHCKPLPESCRRTTIYTVMQDKIETRNAGSVWIVCRAKARTVADHYHLLYSMHPLKTFRHSIIASFLAHENSHRHLLRLGIMQRPDSTSLLGQRHRLGQSLLECRSTQPCRRGIWSLSR